MRKFWYNPNIVGPGLLWLVGLAMQIGGWVNQSIAITLLVIAFLWFIAFAFYWLKKWKKASSATDDLKMEVSQAFYSSTKIEHSDRGQRASHFIVKVELALHIKKPNIQLSWIRLYIAGKYLEPVKSLPLLRDDIRYSDETYELIFEVPVHTFLKGRYSIGSIRPDKSNPEAQIYMKASGQDWYSKPFSIPSEREIN